MSKHTNEKLVVMPRGHNGIDAVQIWSEQDGNGRVCTMTNSAHDEAKAARIVLCWNTHDDLVNALKTITAQYKRLVEDETCDHAVDLCWCGERRDTEWAEAVLAKAEAR